jgi:hypothetical protein
MLSGGVVMLHNNARPHSAAATQDLIATFGWEHFDHPPYSPDLLLLLLLLLLLTANGFSPGGSGAPSDFHVFLHQKTFLGGRRFHDDSEVKEAVHTLFASQAAPFYDAGIQKLVPRYKCLNNGRNYVEK